MRRTFGSVEVTSAFPDSAALRGVALLHVLRFFRGDGDDRPKNRIWVLVIFFLFFVTYCSLPKSQLFFLTTGIPRIVQFFGPQQTPLLEKPH